MFKLSALNETNENESNFDKPRKDTKEAQEAQAFELYNEALRLQQIDHRDEAVKVYEQLLETPLIVESATTLVNEHNEAIEHPLKDPGLILKYSAHKNVASICASKGDKNKAMENYLQAVMLDTSDVTLWHKIGILAAKLSNLYLSRRALTQGLECNPNHWPCLDSVITVCYSILDYESCLKWIAKALKRDSYYKKGIVLRRKMISECPHLRKDFDHIFQNCGSHVFEMVIPAEDADEFLNEANILRDNFRKWTAPPEIPIVPIKIPLKSLSWLNLGRSIVATYQFIETQEEPISITSPIDMRFFGADVRSVYEPTAQTESVVKPISSRVLSERENRPESESNCASCDSSGTPSLVEAANDSKSTPAESNDSNQAKKALKRKKPTEKPSEQSRRSKRRSSRMKPRLHSKSVEDPAPSQEFDFRDRMRRLLPKSLLVPQKPMDMDSDTNSQSSSLVDPDQDLNNSISGVEGSPFVQSFQKEANIMLNDSAVQTDTLLTIREVNKVTVAADDIRPVSDPSNFESTTTLKRCNESLQEETDTRTPKRGKNEVDVKESQITQENNIPSNSTSSLPSAIDKMSVDDNTDVATSREQNSCNVVEKKQNEDTPLDDPTTRDIPQRVSKEDLEEGEEVRQFIDAYNDTNNGILHLLFLYCRAIGRRSHVAWESGLKEVFLQAFDIMQPSLRVEPFAESDLKIKDRVSLAYYMLTHMECILDKKYKKHSVDFKYVPSNLEYRDMGYIIEASYHPEILEFDEMPQYRFKNFVLRFHWVRANYFFLKGDKMSVIGELTMCSKLCFEGMEIHLRHLEHHNVINPKSILKRLNSLKRFQLLERIEALLEHNEFTEALKVLNANITPFESCGLDSLDLERPKLMTYSLKAAVGLGDTEMLLRVLLNTLDESAQQLQYLYVKKSQKEPKYKRLYDSWQSLCNLCCTTFAECLEENVECLANVKKGDLAVCAENCVSLNHHNLVHLPSRSQLILKAAYVKQIFTPWILLYRVTDFAETQSDVTDSNKVSSSLSILMACHDWFGEKGCCCVDNGSMVRLLLKRLMSHMSILNERSMDEESDLNTSLTDSEKSNSASPQKKKSKIQTCIEQCIYCLFGYPSKLGKSSPLYDHGSQPCAFRWADSFLVYEYFKPGNIPAFDSYKVNTIMSDVAGLLIRIVKLLPAKINTKLSSSLKSLDEYLKKDDIERDLQLEPVCDDADFPILADIYYLLADYYFKNKDMPQAGKYYLHDLCVNPHRFDSWAALALVKSSILDQRLRLCSSKLYNQVSHKEESIVSYSRAALFCFQKAMKIEDCSTTLWIEYGTLAYWMHSYFSRQIKLKKHASDDTVAVWKKKKSFMLRQAEKCFEAALGCDSDDISSEEWLILYMLGKVQEKKQETPRKYLSNYSRAASLLHRKHARYPKKIQFKLYQTDYAIEALEMYYRIHCSSLKLVQHEINVLNGFEDGEQRDVLTKEDFDLIGDIIDEAEASHFVRRESLPYHQFHDKPVECNTRKTVNVTKLVVRQSENGAKLSMGSLVPDSIVSALTSEMSTVDDQQMETCDTFSVNELTLSRTSETVNPFQSICDRTVDDVQESVESSDQSYPLTKEKRFELCSKIFKSCVAGLHLCLGRLPQHYKAIYRLADLYWRCSPETRHTTWSCDLLLGSDSPWQGLSHMPCPGLLSERNKTNLFNGVWKIPVDEVDRPGSFGYHLYRCILLLLDVLCALKHHRKLFYLHNILNRTPDQGKKYLKDSDRVLACKKALSYCIKALYKKVSNASAEDVVTTDEKLQFLMDAGKVCQQKQRVSDPVEDVLPKKQTEWHKELLIMCYEKYIASMPVISTPLPNLDFVPAVVKVERILKFCQQHTGSVPSTPKSQLAKFSPQFDFKLCDISSKCSTPAGSKATDLLRAQKKDQRPLESSVAKSQKTNETGEGDSEKTFIQASITRSEDVILQKSKSNDEVTRDPTSNDQGYSTVTLLDKTTDNQVVSKSELVKDPDGVIRDVEAGGRMKPVLASGHSFDIESILASGNQPHLDNSHCNEVTPTTPCLHGTSPSSVINHMGGPNLIASSSTKPDCQTQTSKSDVTPEKLPAFTSSDESPALPGAEITTIIQGGKTYTKIVAGHPNSDLSPSPRSAFTSRKNSDANLHIRSLKQQSRGALARSASLPETSQVLARKCLHRTASVSDYTKQKLKSTILMKTSASLVKKPSITKAEMDEIMGDFESSQSEDEEEVETNFKPLAAAPCQSPAASCAPIDIPVAVTPIPVTVVTEHESDEHI